MLRWPVWIGIVCDDLEVQRRFYRDVLGLTELKSGENFVWFDFDGKLLELLAKAPLPQYLRRSVTFAFEVEDIHSARAELIDRGVKPVTEIEGGPESLQYWAYFQDAEGNLFELVQRLRLGVPTMDGFRVAQLDHVELFVPDRYAAAAWYARTLGLQVVPEYEHWAADPRGPLMIATAQAGTKLTLFAGELQGPRSTAGFHLVAFRVSLRDFDAFLAHVRKNPVFGEQGEEVRELAVRDHGAALSVYFRDPYGHRLEVTSYDVATAPVVGGE